MQGICIGMEYSSKPAKNEGDPLKRRQTLQLMFVDRFPFEKRTSRMVYHGVIVVWSLPVFPCLPFVSFLVFIPFLGQFLLASFPPSFLSVVPVCFFPILFFLLLHLHFVKFLLSACKYSFYPAVLFSRLVLRSGTKPKRRQKRRQNSRQAAWHELGQEQASLLPHPATTATTTIATAGPSCAFAAGICLFSYQHQQSTNSACITAITAAADAAAADADAAGAGAGSCW